MKDSHSLVQQRENAEQMEHGVALILFVKVRCNFIFVLIGLNNYNHYNITTYNKTYSMLLTKKEHLV